MAVTSATPKILPFKTAKAWQQWLAKNYKLPEGIWLRFYKKDSGVETVTYDEALDVALCYGWIDGQAKKLDTKSYIQKFTPRRARSMWSARNQEHVARLIKARKMRAPGLAEIERAKKDGRWAQAYGSPANTKVPDDFLAALAKHKKAEAFFKTLNRANTYAIAWRLATAAKPETRERRFKNLLEMMKRGEKLH